MLGVPDLGLLNWEFGTTTFGMFWFLLPILCLLTLLPLPVVSALLTTSSLITNFNIQPLIPTDTPPKMALPNFATLLTHLTTATTAAYPSHSVSPYHRVKVLLLTWDTSVAEPARDREARDLEALFRGVYHYETEFWTIPARRAAVEVSRKVAGVLDGCGKGDLVVVYYGGWAKGSVWAAR